MKFANFYKVKTRYKYICADKISASAVNMKKKKKLTYYIQDWVKHRARILILDILKYRAKI